MIVRFVKNNSLKYGLLENGTVKPLKGDPFGSIETTEEEFELNEISLKSPVAPSKVVCIGLNYKDHAEEVNLPLPNEPLIFLKPSTSVIGTLENVIYPQQTERLDFEGELGVVIKKRAYKINRNQATDYILGYTCANDITARDLQFNDGQWTRGKSFDTFCPIGPGIVQDLDPSSLDIILKVNGEIKQKSNTSQLIFDVPYIVEYVSQIMTLLPGDVVITGTPPGIDSMNVGDEVSVTIEGIGTLKNQIKSDE